jgi:hypothetical protein
LKRALTRDPAVPRNDFFGTKTADFFAPWATESSPPFRHVSDLGSFGGHGEIWQPLWSPQKSWF